MYGVLTGLIIAHPSSYKITLGVHWQRVTPLRGVSEDLIGEVLAIVAISRRAPLTLNSARSQPKNKIKSGQAARQFFTYSVGLCQEHTPGSSLPLLLVADQTPLSICRVPMGRRTRRRLNARQPNGINHRHPLFLTCMLPADRCQNKKTCADRGMLACPVSCT